MSTADAVAAEETSRRPMGFLDVTLPDELFQELPAEELDAWEGGSET